MGVLPPYKRVDGKLPAHPKSGLSHKLIKGHGGTLHKHGHSTKPAMLLRARGLGGNFARPIIGAKQVLEGFTEPGHIRSFFNKDLAYEVKVGGARAIRFVDNTS